MSKAKQPKSTEIIIANAVRKSCIKTARQAFRDASMRGLCSEGAIEAAIGAMQSLDVEKIAAEISRDKQ